MALLTTKATAAAITALLQKGARAPSRQGFTPQTRFTKKLHPWKVRYSTARKAYLVYIPDGSVAGVTLGLSELTPDEKFADWYILDQSQFEDATEAILYLYGNRVSFVAPDPHDTEAEKPSFQCLIARITDMTKASAQKVEVKQIVTSTISLGGGAASNVFPGPLQVEMVGDTLWLVQRWCRAKGGMYEFVELTNGEDDDIGEGKTYVDIGGTGCTIKYASRIRLFTHAEDHSEGLIKAWDPAEDTAAQE
jgi:hypothetical protein